MKILNGILSVRKNNEEAFRCKVDGDLLDCFMTSSANAVSLKGINGRGVSGIVEVDLSSVKELCELKKKKSSKPKFRSTKKYGGRFSSNRDALNELKKHINKDIISINFGRNHVGWEMVWRMRVEEKIQNFPKNMGR